MAVEECYICFEPIHCITEKVFEEEDDSTPSSSSSSPLSSSSSSSSSPSSPPSSSSSSSPLRTLPPRTSKRRAVYGRPGSSTGKKIPSPAKIGTLLGCGKEHQYCLECLAKYVDTEVKARHWPVCCPSSSCTRQISAKLIEAVLGEGALEWHMLGVEHAISNKAATTSSVDVAKKLLKVPETATADEIREAYKREALRTHPDRSTNIGGPDDAYYVLSNTERRREYDQARKSQSRYSSWSTTAEPHAEADTVFGGVFEELLRPEVENPRSFYSPIGMASGAALGFICGGVPGALLGGFGGKQLGQIRDHKGVSVMEAFGRLEHSHKAAIIATLAAKIFASLQ
ncbi:hypothetical protein BG006_004556 [Podila minutissima]|uniref:J domain-containing protein n=1 Tax=Podila minutissima TaxID=64525 RepID=A0A9P5SNJ9_9FUNG|nr:hypothetical protein BG006_004556 [Podila minutissima]